MLLPIRQLQVYGHRVRLGEKKNYHMLKRKEAGYLRNCLFFLSPNVTMNDVIFMSKGELVIKGVSRLPQSYSLSLCTSIYSIEAIKKTAYKFANRAAVIISPGTESTVSVAFNFAGTYAKSDPEQVIADFCNELLDQDLRQRIKNETEPLRNLLLAQAFSRTRLADKNPP